MRIEYQLTRQDWTEGSAAAAARVQARQVKETRWKSRIMIVLLSAVAWLSASAMGSRGWFIALTPFLGLGWIALLNGTQQLFKQRSGKTKSRAILRIAGNIYLIGAILLGSAIVLMDSDRLPLVEALRQLAIPQIGWLMLLTWLVYLGVQTRRKTAEAKWDRTPSLHRHRTMDIGREGITQSDFATRSEFTWDAFELQQETRNLFLLFTSEANAIIVPKRAFAEEAELAEMREFLKRIARPAARGFEVITSPVAEGK